MQRRCGAQSDRNRFFKNASLLAFLVLLMWHTSMLAGSSFRNVLTPSSLSQSSVLAMVQDSLGFLWIGTKDGLNRFDGYKYVSYKYDIDDDGTLSNNEISCLELQDNRYLWIGTRSGGINRLDLSNSRITRYNGLTYDDLIRDLYIDRQGRLWAGTSEGLFYYEAGEGEDKGRFVNASRNAIYRRHTNEPFGPIRKNISVVSVYQHSERKLLVGAEEGLFEYDMDDGTAFRSISEETIERTVFTKIRRDSQGQLWASSYDGLFRLTHRLNNNSWRVQRFHAEAPEGRRLPVDWVEDFTEDDQANLWLATRGGGLVRMADNTVKEVFTYSESSENGIPDNIINALLIDRTGVLWVGTESHELVYLDLYAKQFKVLLPGQQSGLSDNLVTAITGNENVLAVGTAASGIDVFRRSGGQLQRLQNIPRVILRDGAWKSEISALLLDSDSMLWIGSAANSLVVYDGRRFDSYVVDGFIFSLFEDDRDNIWFGTWGQGIGYINKYSRQIERYNETPAHMLGLGSDKALAVFKDSRDLLWVGTKGGGLSVAPIEDVMRRRGSFTVFRHKSGETNTLAYNDVYDIREDSYGNLWVATGRGLNKIELGRSTPVSEILKGQVSFSHLSEQDGLPGGLVYSIREDETGHLWLGTNKGLCRYHPSSGKLVSFGRNDGLPGEQFNLNSAFRDAASGHLFFGGVNGITIFHPDSIVNNPFDARVAITDFRLHNRSVLPRQKIGNRVLLDKNIFSSEELRLAHSDNEISFEFSALHFSSPDKIRYAYRLVGFNDEWQETGSQNRRVTYTNLRFGTYTLQVRATNNDGVWAPGMRELTLIIDPPVYLTVWAYLLYGLFFLFLLFVFRKYSLIAVKKKNQLIIESLEHKKETEIAEAKMRFFTNVSHEIRTPLTLIHAPLQQLIDRQELDRETRDVLNMIYRNVKRLLTQVNQLLELRKMDKGELSLRNSVFPLETLVQETLLDFEPLLRQNKVQVEIKAPNESLVSADKRLLTTVVHNLLSNSVKYAPPGSTLHLSIDYSQNSEAESWYTLRFCDEGPGIPESEIDSVFNRFYQVRSEGYEHLAGSGIGLSIVRDFVEKMKGSVKAYNLDAKGCCFEVLLPEGNLQQQEAAYSHQEEVTEESSSPDLSDSEQGLSAGKGDQKQPLLVVVEDDADLADYLRKVFAPRFRTIVFHNGRKAHEELAGLMPDLVICDVMLPGMSGIEVTRALKTSKETCHIPVVMLTARTDDEHMVEGFESGADSYLTKPFNIHVLEAQVASVLQSREAFKQRFSKQMVLEPTEEAITPMDERFLKRLMEITEQKLSDPTFDVSFLIDEMHMSHSIILKKVKGLTGLSLVEFIRSMRIKKAAQIFRQDKLSVSEVGFMVGFSDPKYFSKCFTKEMGVKPTDYLKQHHS